MEKNMENMELAFVITDSTKQSGKLCCNSNAENLIKYIDTITKEVKSKDLSNTDLETVKLYKKQFTSLRTGIQKGVKEYKDMYINPCLQALKVDVERVTTAIESGESIIDTKLEEIEKRRINAMNIVLSSYIDELCSEFGFNDADKSKIELKKSYYNKTANESETYDDIKAQCEDIKKAKEQKETDIQLIMTLCKAHNVNAEPYVDMLDFLSCSVICNKITALTEKLKETKETVKEEPKGKTETRKTVTVTLTYRESFGKELTRFLIDNGVDFTFVK